MENLTALYILISLAGIAIWFFLTQWAHQIEKRNRYMETQIRLSAQIALKQGVDSDTVTGILARCKLPYLSIEDHSEDKIRRLNHEREFNLITMEQYKIKIEEIKKVDEAYATRNIGKT